MFYEFSVHDRYGLIWFEPPTNHDPSVCDTFGCFPWFPSEKASPADRQQFRFRGRKRRFLKKIERFFEFEEWSPIAKRSREIHHLAMYYESWVYEILWNYTSTLINQMPVTIPPFHHPRTKNMGGSENGGKPKVIHSYPFYVRIFPLSTI